MRRLTAVWPTRFDTVFRSHGDIEIFLDVPVVVAEQDTNASVWILKIAFICWSNTLPRIVRRLYLQLLLSAQQNTTHRGARGQEADVAFHEQEGRICVSSGSAEHPVPAADDLPPTAYSPHR